MMTTGLDSPAFLMRQAFRRYVSSVMVLTYTDADHHAYGMTATSVCSVSVEPPTILACVNRQARTHREIVRGRRFAVSLLAEEQRLVSEFCAAPGSRKRLPNNWVVESPGRVPVVREALGSLQCELSEVHEAGSHSIFIGSVVGVELGPPANPLLYFDGAYRSIGEVEEELSCLEQAGIIW
jgi:flavin reductase (DIM6/NTAB) family NADH-FMN oxidoreductase RutF